MTDTHERPYLSLIIPARDEENRLPPTLHRVMDYLRQQPYAAEILVVENGSSDNTSAAVEQFIAQQLRDSDTVSIRLLHSSPGKGAAVRAGMLAGEGEYLIISDTDLAVPIEEVKKFLPPQLPTRFDIAIASREVAGAVRHNEPPYRHLMGRVFNLLVRLLAVPNIQDTQCGFKCFSREAAQRVFPLQQIDGWGFDVEVLYIARHHGLKLVEIPVNWFYGEDSRVSPVRDTISMFSELIKIRRNGRAGLYDQDATQTWTDKLPVA